jgi:protein TonB
MRKRDKFRSALAASFVLHLLLLWPAVSLVRQGETAQSLSVVLQPGKGRPLDDVASAAPPAPAHGIREAAKPMRAPEPVPQALPQTEPQPPGNTPASTTEIASRSETRSATGSAGSRAAAAAVDAGAGLDADGVRQYRMALAVEARRFKRYPSRALAEEIGGTVEVRVSVAAGGQPQEVALAHSSGYDALDDAALDMLRKAAPRTAVPELLRRRSFVIDLPVVFDVASE